MALEHSLIAALPLTLGLSLLQPAIAGDNGTNASPLTSPALPLGNALPDAGVPEGYLFNLRPMGLQLGSALANDGVYLTGRTLQQAIGITSGGLKRERFIRDSTSLALISTCIGSRGYKEVLSIFSWMILPA